MTWAYRAGTFATTVSINPYTAGGNTLAAGGAVSASDRVLVAVLVFNSANTAIPPAPTVSDNINTGNYHEDVVVTFISGGNGSRFSLFSFGGSVSGTPTVKVVTSNPSGQHGGFSVAAYSGLSTANDGTGVDVTQTATSTSSSPSTGASSTTSAANELVFATYADLGYATTLGVGTGFTLRGKHDSDADSYQGLMEDKDSGASGSTETATATTSASTQWGMIEAVYKLAASGGTTPNARSLIVLQAVNRAATY